MMNTTRKPTPSDLNLLMLEVISDTRLQLIIRMFIKLNSHKKRLLVRITRGLE